MTIHSQIMCMYFSMWSQQRLQNRKSRLKYQTQLIWHKTTDNGHNITKISKHSMNFPTPMNKRMHSQTTETSYSWTLLECAGCRCDGGTTLLYWYEELVSTAWTDAGRSFQTPSSRDELCGIDWDDTEPLPPAAYALPSDDLAVPWDAGWADEVLLAESSPLVATAPPATPPLDPDRSTGSPEYSCMHGKKIKNMAKLQTTFLCLRHDLCLSQIGRLLLLPQGSGTLCRMTSHLHHLFLFSAINWRHFYFRSLILTLFLGLFCCEFFCVAPQCCWSFILRPP